MRNRNGEKTDLHRTTGTSPPDNGTTPQASIGSGGVLVGSVTCVPTGDWKARLSQIGLLFLGTRANGKERSQQADTCAKGSSRVFLGGSRK
jgi:hypothetical protein